MLSLAETKLIFPLVALIVLYSVFVATKVLIISVLATAGQSWHSIKVISPALSPLTTLTTSGLGKGKILGGDTVRTADPNCLKGYSLPYDNSSAVKATRKEEGDLCYNYAGLPESLLHVLLPGSGRTLPADGKERINVLFSFYSTRSLFFIKLPSSSYHNVNLECPNYILDE